MDGSNTSILVRRSRLERQRCLECRSSLRRRTPVQPGARLLLPVVVHVAVVPGHQRAAEVVGPGPTGDAGGHLGAEVLKGRVQERQRALIGVRLPLQGAHLHRQAPKASEGPQLSDGLGAHEFDPLPFMRVIDVTWMRPAGAEVRHFCQPRCGAAWLSQAG